MLELKKITKDYTVFDTTTTVLKGIDLTFRNNEFISILGPSGCGKTTMLNIIGGLDKFTTGDLIINGKSTKNYDDRDWDTYRNHSIGFVFQNYNLIPHQNVLKNVELALSIGGISKKERRLRAIEALTQVGLEEHMYKKPNQLSGGQCQRVSIARALIANPDIVLADEPTGALDTETSVQIMKILKEISKDRLVIMVTHNPELAQEYSTRIVKMIDGMITEDSNPVTEEEMKLMIVECDKKAKNRSIKEIKRDIKKSSMSIKTSVGLSASNLLTKKKRTLLTAIACSIGIIGISVILSVSSGMKDYVAEVEMNSSSLSYINIAYSHVDANKLVSDLPSGDKVELPKYPTDTNSIYSYEDTKISLNGDIQRINNIYINYLEKNINGNTPETDLVLGIGYMYKMNMNLIGIDSKSGKYKTINTNATNGLYEEYYWKEILDNTEYIESQYTVLATLNGTNPIPTKYNEVVLVVDEYNRVPAAILEQLGIHANGDYAEVKYEDLLGMEFRLVSNNNYYKTKENQGYLIFEPIKSQEELKEAYDGGESIKITSIIRQKEDASNSWLSVGIGYPKALTEYVIENSSTSNIVEYQKKYPYYDIFTGEAFGEGYGSISSIFGNAYSYEGNMMEIGAPLYPASIYIYPKNFESKDRIIEVLDKWNDEVVYTVYGTDVDENGTLIADKFKIKYNDFTQLIVSMLSNLIDIITYSLVAFSSISLIVSSIMIAIITYASVMERTKEIGTLRSLGARKQDISTVFLSEAAIIGAASAVIALIMTLIINGIINIVLNNIVGINTIASLRFTTALLMFVLCIGLNLLASLVPAKIAANKDPVVALRTE